MDGNNTLITIGNDTSNTRARDFTRRGKKIYTIMI